MLDKSKFAALRQTERVWAVAAIHGEVDHLKRLVAVLEDCFEVGDRLVFLGNYLGHGGAIRDTLDELLGLRRRLLARPGMMVCDVVFLRGAQEEMWSKLMQIHLALNPADVLQWMLGRGLAATLEAYGGDPHLSRARFGATELARWTGQLRSAMQQHPGHYALMSALRRAAYTDDGGLLFVHAGIDPSRPLSAQGDSLWWGGGGFDDLAEPYGGFARVVRGFDADHAGVTINDHTATLDAGCGFGGPLRACCFDRDGQLVDQIEG